jgi:Domain of unknown function (DUF4112)
MPDISHLGGMTINTRANSTRQRRPIVIDQDGREVSSGPFEAAGGFDAGAFSAQGAFWQAGFSGTLTREQRIARLEALAQLLDMAFILPGTNIRYGLDGLIGLIPVVGDLLTTAISLWIVREARSLGAPRYLVARMLGNVALDGVIGIVPVVGDAFDVMWRANIRNMRLLRKWIDKNG